MGHIRFETFVLTELEQRGFDDICVTVSPDNYHDKMSFATIAATFNGFKVSYVYPRPYEAPVSDEEAEFIAYYLQTEAQIKE
jgi:hypothetical protein